MESQIENESPLHKWLAHDFYRDRTGFTNYANVEAEDVARAFHTLDDIIRDVTKNEKTIHDFNLCDPAPIRPQNMGEERSVNRLLRAELNYDIDTEKQTWQQHRASFNVDQRTVFDTIVNDCETYENNNSLTDTSSSGTHIFFIDAPGGTGKTFTLNTIAAYFRSKKKVVLCNASSGIAAVLMKGGLTAHARFKIPLKILPDSNCSITARMDAGVKVQWRAKM